MRVSWLLSIRHGTRTVVAVAAAASPENEGAPLQDQPDIAADEAADEAEARLPQLHRVPLAALTDILAGGLADALFAIRSGPSTELPALTAPRRPSLSPRWPGVLPVASQPDAASPGGLLLIVLG